MLEIISSKTIAVLTKVADGYGPGEDNGDMYSREAFQYGVSK